MPKRRIVDQCSVHHDHHNHASIGCPRCTIVCTARCKQRLPMTSFEPNSKFVKSICRPCDANSHAKVRGAKQTLSDKKRCTCKKAGTLQRHGLRIACKCSGSPCKPHVQRLPPSGVVLIGRDTTSVESWGTRSIHNSIATAAQFMHMSTDCTAVF